MSLESYTGKIADLVVTNPQPTDPKSQGDDHLRGIKFTMVQDAVRVSGSPLQQMGAFATEGENYHWDASVANELVLKRGTAAVPGAEVLKVKDGVLLPVQTGPAFSATDAATTSSAGATVQIVFDTEVFDTDNAFDGTKFQPQVEGYYQVNAACSTGVNTAASSMTCTLRKNGATLYTAFTNNLAGFSTQSSISEVVYMNGTTDHLDVQGRNGSNANIGVSRFSAFLARKA